MTSEPGGEEEGDASLMAALFNRRRQWAPLSSDQIKLVDEFVAGRLAGEAAFAAERLVHENAFAAERVMERRLLQQAESSPAPPPALTETIFRNAERAPARRSLVKRPSWALLLSWKVAGVAVVSAAALVLGGELLLNPARSPIGFEPDAREANNNSAAPSVQVAMATIANRDLLAEPSDAKLRSDAGRSSTPRKEPETSGTETPRFYDIEVPSDLLAGWMTRARSGSQIPPAELEPLIGRLQTFRSSPNRAIVFDEALQSRLPQPTPPGVPKQTSSTRVRVYDLGQQPADDLRKAINIDANQKLAPGYLVTLRP